MTTGTFFLAVAATALAAATTAALDANFFSRALVTGDRLVTCSYNWTFVNGFPSEALWQSFNTLETLANIQIAEQSTRWSAVFANTYKTTPVIVDNCFDDHQWALLFWVRAHAATGNTSYLTRAAAVFDYTIANGWTTSVCGGGVLWCPKPTNPYKNAVTNELFLSSAMALHPFTAIVGKPANFYLDWALKEWAWLSASGMINPQSLVNDGLDGSCKNNGGATWT